MNEHQASVLNKLTDKSPVLGVIGLAIVYRRSLIGTIGIGGSAVFAVTKALGWI
jgi:hypothetical protein